MLLCVAFTSINAQTRPNSKYYELYLDTTKGIPVMEHYILVLHQYNDTKDKGFAKIRKDLPLRKDTLIPRSNKNLWRSIETYIASLSGSYDTIQVWTGRIYNSDKKVPTYYWKAIQLKLQGVTINTLGFMCENKELQSKAILKDYTCTVKQIESSVGKKLFVVESIPGFKNNSDREVVIKDNNIMIKPHTTNYSTN